MSKEAAHWPFLIKARTRRKEQKVVPGGVDNILNRVLYIQNMLEQRDGFRPENRVDTKLSYTQISKSLSLSMKKAWRLYE